MIHDGAQAYTWRELRFSFWRHMFLELTNRNPGLVGWTETGSDWSKWASVLTGLRIVLCSSWNGTKDCLRTVYEILSPCPPVPLTVRQHSLIFSWLISTGEREMSPSSVTPPPVSGLLLPPPREQRIAIIFRRGYLLYEYSSRCATITMFSLPLTIFIRADITENNIV